MGCELLWREIADQDRLLPRSDAGVDDVGEVVVFPRGSGSNLNFINHKELRADERVLDLFDRDIASPDERGFELVKKSLCRGVFRPSGREREFIYPRAAEGGFPTLAISEKREDAGGFELLTDFGDPGSIGVISRREKFVNASFVKRFWDATFAAPANDVLARRDLFRAKFSR